MRADHAVGADLDAFADLGAGVNYRRGVDARHL